MDTAKVYYMDGRSHDMQTGLVAKMLTVFDAAGLGELVRPHDIVAIKMHCGEWNNTGYLRPVYARALADRVKELGGRPFVCDTITLPYGGYAYRVTGLDLLTTAARNGFNMATLGCPFLAADGFNGTDDLRVELPEGVILKEAYIAKAIASADVLIALTHFKGHGVGVIGGALKNLGIGAQSRRGKLNVHLCGHPRYGLMAIMDYHPEKCVGRAQCQYWQRCEDSCPYGLVSVREDGLSFDPQECRDCMLCPGIRSQCGVMARSMERWRDSLLALNAAIGDAALGAVKAVGREKVGFINMAIDISPGCDCVSFSDVPILGNLGVLASRDPVALDRACLDLAVEAEGAHGSMAEDKGVMERGMKKFENISVAAEGVREDIQIRAGVENGLGTADYELMEVEPRPDALTFLPREDPRVSGLRLRRAYGVEDPFPKGRFGGWGFDRREEIELSRFS